MAKKVFLIFNLFFALLFASEAQAQFFRGFAVQAGTELPFQIGAHAKVYLPQHFHARAGVGFSADFLSDLNGNVTGGIGILGTNTAKVAAASMSNAYLIDLRIGWSLNTERGLYFEGGYAYLAGGGKSISDEELEDAIGNSLASGNPNADAAVTLHNVTVHGGYLFPLSDNFNISFEVGLIKPVIANSDIQYSSSSSSLNDEEDEINNYMEDKYIGSAFFLTAAVWLAYEF